jgi:hypothetical protein
MIIGKGYSAAEEPIERAARQAARAFCDLVESPRIAKTRRTKELEQCSVSV